VFQLKKTRNGAIANMTQQQGATHRSSGHFVPKTLGLGRLPNNNFSNTKGVRKIASMPCVAMLALLAISDIPKNGIKCDNTNFNNFLKKGVRFCYLVLTVYRGTFLFFSKGVPYFAIKVKQVYEGRNFKKIFFFAKEVSY